jgi:hypothetical protein
LTFHHAPSNYDCDFCAFVRGEERPPWTLLPDVVWADTETTAWMNPRWWDGNPGNVLVHVFPRHRGDGLYGASTRMTTPDERRPYADRLRAALEQPDG